jgi:hypothetical protein
MKVEAYRQATLRKGNAERVSWIPEHLAIVGSTVALRGRGEWEVLAASAPMAAAIVERNARDYRHQRGASDVNFADVLRETHRLMAEGR